ncbi:S8 family peptidase [Thiohalospira halophila]|uniref:S8 family peptidase n=1 Tax=Thiohalospira halophila TaxID=381300 RepID=UPI0013565F00|nr:S8 family peptidase [Thiohalospira halophila]
MRAWSDNLAPMELTPWDEGEQATIQLQSLESFGVPRASEKIKPGTESASSHTYEVVLHSERHTEVLEAFFEYANLLQVDFWVSQVRYVGGIIFVPLEADKKQLEEISKFAFLRAIRPMPALRTFRPPMLRGDLTPIPELPEEEVKDEETRVAVFDGGLPHGSPLTKWVQSIEPPGIGAAIPDALAHGEQVTSAVLFGHVTPNRKLQAPYSRIDHVRVIDDQINSDIGLYRLLDRILEHLDSATEKYRFVNLSLGPDVPIEDDEIDRWTAELDARAIGGDTLFSVAAGNTGDRDSLSHLNRIQPPSDGVNVLAVGACDAIYDDVWSRCDYSSVGPGRTPGIAKPDGVSFGGSFERPFGTIASGSGVGLSATQGTSFAAPFALHTALGVNALLERAISPLGVRALFVHKADQAELPPEEVGWGRFESDPITLLECADNEVTVLYEGMLPLKEYLRAPIPIPTTGLEGMVEITATLVIAPEIDAAFTHAYTRGGLQAVFRPNSNKSQGNSPTSPAGSEDFFSSKRLYKRAEYELRQDGHKWEPCWKASRRKQGSKLHNPCFDVYYHTRNEGRNDQDPEPIPYSLVVTVHSPRVKDLYEKTLHAYSDVLVPLEPQVEIRTQL